MHEADIFKHRERRVHAEPGGVQWPRDSTNRLHIPCVIYLSFQLIIQSCLCKLVLTEQNSASH